ncbi:nSTAND1 domain-containing NTPase [Desulfotignum balticum]|uniref:nSTAND1 domain-containing NTPase n=1 Tax=Desulfotignum balticum TaxID=115781 RepID=UPI0004230DDC|nr:AAA family ATPase [Desulfotignum balticum]
MKTIRIFISSPGDVQEEREKAREVIRRLQRRYLGRLELLSLLWEDLPLSADTSFQEGIDWVISHDRGIDIAVFILWSRLGSPLGKRITRTDGSLYRSGTEREFDLMLRARDACLEKEGPGRPQILAYFRSDEEGFHRIQRGKSTRDLKQMVEQREQVEHFIQEHFYDADTGTNIRAFHSFDAPATFANRLRVHLQNVLDEIVKESAVPAQGWDISEKGAPYRGLEVFDVAHEQIFFGREQEISDIQVALDHQAKAGHAFVLIVGASGSGKSSLARAGVIPALKYFETGAVHYRYAVMTPGQYASDLFSGLARTLVSETALPEYAGTGQSIESLAESLKKDPDLAYQMGLAPVLKKTDDGKTEETRLLLLIDQLEELFTHTSLTKETVTQFIQAIQVLSGTGRIRILATLRSDFYARLQEYPRLVELKQGQGQYDLLPPGKAHIHRIITEPAWLAGIQFEEDLQTGERLDQRILNDAIDHPEALPLLEYTMRELFENRTQEGMLTFKLYEALGGVEGALGKRAEQIWQQLPEPTQNIVPKLFRALVTVSEDQEYTSQPMILNDYLDVSGGQQNDLQLALEVFVQARLLISHKTQGDQVVIRLAHEALIRCWPRLNQWLMDAREFLQARTRLDQALKHWLEKDRPKDLLLPEGIAIEEAMVLQIKWSNELTAEQMDYIERSAKYYEKKRKKRVQNFQIASVVFLILAVVSIIAGGIAWKKTNAVKQEKQIAIEQMNRADQAAENALIQSRIAEQKSKEAELRAREATENLKKARHNFGIIYYEKLKKALRQDVLNYNEAHLCALYAIENIDPEKGEKETIFAKTVVDNVRSNPLIHSAVTNAHHDSAIRVVTFSPDGKTIASSSSDSMIHMWNIDSGKLIGTLLFEEHKKINDLSFSPDGNTLVSACANGMVVLWDVVSKKVKTEFTKRESGIEIVIFSPDGRTITSGLSDGTIKLWDVVSGTPTMTLTGHDSTVTSLCYSLDGKTLASGSTDKTIRLWDVKSGNLKKTYIGHSGVTQSVFYSPDGKGLCSASSDRTIRVWNGVDKTTVSLKDEAYQEPRKLPKGPRPMAFSPGGKILASCVEGRTIRLWDAVSGKLQKRLNGHTSVVTSLSFSPDGKTLVSGSMDRTIRVWDVVSGKAKSEFSGHFNSVNSISFSPDSRIIASGSQDGRVILRDVISGEVKSYLQSHEKGVNCLAFSPDGGTLASGSTDTTIKLWNLDSGRGILSLTLHGHAKSISVITFSPDGKLLASGANRSVIIWDTVSGKLKAELKTDSRIAALSFSPDGQILALALNNGTIVLWNPTSENQRITLKGDGWGNSLDHMCFSPDSKTLASASIDDGMVRFWDVNTGDAKGVLTKGVFSNYMCFSSDGQFLALETNDYSDSVRIASVQLWDMASQKLILTLKGYPGNYRSMQFSPDGKILAIGSDDGTLQLWDLSPKNNVVQLKGGGIVSELVFSHDGTTLASRQREGIIRLLDLSSQKVKDMSLHGHWIDFQALSPDCKLVALGSNNTVRLQNLISGREQVSLAGHSAGLKSLKFSFDGQILAAWFEEGVIQLWNTSSGKLKTTIKGQSGEIISLFFSPDADLLASNVNGTLQLWDVSSSQEKYVLKNPPNDFSAGAFSTDGRILASGSVNGRIRLWKLNTGEIKKVIIGHSEAVKTLAFSPDNQFLISSDKNEVQIWNLASGELIKRFVEYDSISTVSLSTDGQTLALGLEEETIVFRDLSYIYSDNTLPAQEIEIKKTEFNMETSAFSLRPIKKSPNLYGEKNCPPKWSKKNPFSWLAQAESGDGKAMLQMGNLYLQDNRFDLARYWFQKAKQVGFPYAEERLIVLSQIIKTHKADGLLNGIETDIKQKNWDAAIKKCEELLFLDILSEYALWARGWIYDNVLHKPALAELNYRQVIHFMTDFPEAYDRLGWVILLQGRFSEALPFIQQAWELDSHSGDASALHLGHAYLLTGNVNKAGSIYQKYLNKNQTLSPGERDGLLADFDIFIQNGWQPEACRKWRQWFEAAFSEQKHASVRDKERETR